MQEKEITVRVQVYERVTEMQPEDAGLIAAAKDALIKSYSPYSGFKVASAALLANGAIVSGANQENASYPVCLCAEIVTLSACSSQYPGVAINKIAITTHSSKSKSGKPTAPCGQCRQALLEYEQRFKTNIEVILCGENGQVYKVNSVKELLPLYFSVDDLGL
jgi:cytidine deaminase